MVCYIKKILQMVGDQVILRNKEFAKKAVILLLRTKSRPRFLPSNGPNMGFYGQIY